MAKVLNDHINMVSASGHTKAVPIWQIMQWIKMGRFRLDLAKGNAIGYDFADHPAGVEDYQAYLAWEAQQKAMKQARSYVPQPAEAGIAEAALRPRSAEPVAFTQPPDEPDAAASDAVTAPPTPAKDSSEKPTKRPRPQDMI